jgi:CheY-like chemotaxis protein
VVDGVHDRYGMGSANSYHVGAPAELIMPKISSILLVDDEPDIRTIAEMSLSHVGGWRTILASSGQEALELAIAHRPDVILLDVMMPEMDGVATFRALASRSETRDIPVIFMTAKVQSHERERYVGFGAAGVIAKPFDPMRLPQDIEGILAQPVERVAGPGKLDALRKRYTENLGGKIDGLRAAVEQAHRADPTERAAAIAVAHRIAHTLHGTAGSYGLEQVSVAMADVEHELEMLGTSSTGDQAERWRTIDAAIERACTT